MIRNVAPLPFLLLLTGCGSYAAVWLVEIGAIVSTDPVVAIEHNFLNATPEVDEPDPEWTTVQFAEASPSLTFAEIFEVDDNDGAERVLVANGTVMPGVENDEGLYVFTWTNSEGASSTESHSSGYSYSESQDVTLVWTVTLDLGGKASAGTFDLGVTAIAGYTETDEFSTAETEIVFGQIPAESYLDHTTDGNFVFNSATAAECSSSPCTIIATQTATATAPVNAWRTNMDPNGFDGIESAEQGAGIPDDIFGGSN